MPRQSKLLYRGHPVFGDISKKRTSSKTLKQLTSRLPPQLSQELPVALSDLTEMERCHLQDTIKYPSDEQFDLMTSEMEQMTGERLPDFVQAIKTLAGHDPKPSAKLRRQTELPGIALMNIGPEETSEKALQKHVHALPRELFNAIKDLTFENAFFADIFPFEAAISENINTKAVGLINRNTQRQLADRV